MGVFLFLGVVFVWVEGVDFDGRRVFLESKWWFSSGSEVVFGVRGTKQMYFDFLYGIRFDT